jgi:hypothetical protein
MATIILLALACFKQTGAASYNLRLWNLPLT